MSSTEELPKDPVFNFETLWQMFDRNYGCFIPKKIDWNLLYRTYRPKVTEKATDDELFDIMIGLLEHLNDNHVKLRTNNQGPPS